MKKEITIECSDWLIGFLWGCAMTVLLFVIFINTSISNTKHKVDNAYVKGYTDSEKNCKI